MSWASKIYTELKLSRSLTSEEVLEFKTFQNIKLQEYCLFGEEIKSVGLHFDYYNFWNFENETLDLLKPETHEEYYFYLESLLYLIEHFFNPKQIYLNGFIVSVDHIFGDLLCFHINQNRIFLMKTLIDSFSKMDVRNISLDSLNENFNLIYQNIKKLI